MRIDQHQAHLTYCSNIHPGESWEETFNNLKAYTTQVKAQMNTDRFGIGLRLSNLASLDLIAEEKLTEFQDWLQINDLYVFTINGFPYGQFHVSEVKDQVHAPDWTDPDRLSYTKRLFHILARLLPEGMDGGVSTSPLSYRFWYGDEQKLQAAKSIATNQLGDLIAFLAQLKQETGKRLHLDMEPEPDGILETSDEFVAFFKDYMLNAGLEVVTNRLQCTVPEAEAHIREHFQLCYDVCHFAVGYEKPAEAIARIQQAGIRIGRIQISAALGSPGLSQANRQTVIDQLSTFDEPVYLHQAVVRAMDGQLKRYKDLGVALAGLDHDDQEIRTHFHVPVFTETYDQLVSTQKDIVDTLHVWLEKNFTRHLEVETYTWDVLPAPLRTDLVQSIVRELSWVKETLAKA